MRRASREAGIGEAYLKKVSYLIIIFACIPMPCTAVLLELARVCRDMEKLMDQQMHQLESKGRGDTLGPGTGLDMGMMGLEGEGRKVRGVGGNMGDMGF